MKTKFYFRPLTRQEYRKYNFKRQDGVLQSLEYLVHTTIVDPTLEEFKLIEKKDITITEKIGQRLADIIPHLDINVEKIEIDITIPLCTPRQVEKTLQDNIEEIVIKVLKEQKLI